MTAIWLTVLPLVSGATVTPEDQRLIDEASCDEIVKEHRSYSAAAKKVEEEIGQSTSSTTATNAVGVATLAAFGLGFFSWDDHADAHANLAELKAYRDAIAQASRRKSCGL